MTGHQQLDGASAWPWVEEQIGLALDRVMGPLEGLSSLAAGADQRFARLVLERGGRLVAILPFQDYASIFDHASDRTAYERFLGEAAEVTVLPDQPARELAYFRAGQHLVDAADLLRAVWNGLPAEGLGGTADVVSYALDRGKRVLHLNPIEQRVALLP